MAQSTHQLYFSIKIDESENHGASGSSIEKEISGNRYLFTVKKESSPFQGIASHNANGITTTIYGSIDSDRELAIKKTIELVKRIKKQ